MCRKCDSYQGHHKLHFMTKFNYRPEIDGLRALSIIPVVFFHAGYQLFSGGYIGVDIFFVISGYLITSIILKLQIKKQFSILNFYSRRAKRILPSLLLLIFLSLILSVYIVPPEELLVISKSALSSLLFFSNFFFTYNSGYFDLSSEYQPLLHTWSLSIEEQFYILFPFFLIFLSKYKFKILFAVILIIILLSIFFAQWSGNLQVNYPYYEKNFLFYSRSEFSSFMMPFGRIWELFIGSAAAIFIMTKKKYISNFNKFQKNIFSLLGIILIFYAIFLFDNNTFYPSFYTLIPCIGTLILIFFADQKTIVGKILSYKILVKLGLISYSLYLIHFILFSFLRYDFYIFGENYYQDIFIFLITIFFSYLFWKYYEKPIRNSKNNYVYYYLITLSLLIIISSAIIIKSDGLNKRDRFFLSKKINDSFIRSVNGKNCFDLIYENNLENVCKFGIDKNKFDFVLFGDSHSISYYDFFEEYAKKNGLKGLYFGYSGCVPLLDIYSIRGDQNIRNCNQLNTDVTKILEKFKIKKLILISNWTYYTDGGYQSNKLSLLSKVPDSQSNKNISREAFSYGLKKTMQRYNSLGTNLILIKQTPEQKYNSKHLYYKIAKLKDKDKLKKIRMFSVSKEEHLNLQNFVNNEFNLYSNQKNINFIDLNSSFCKKNSCYLGSKDGSFYIDKSHISNSGIKLISNTLSKKLDLTLK